MSRLLGRLSRWAILNSIGPPQARVPGPQRPHLPCVPRAFLDPPSPGGFLPAAPPPPPPRPAQPQQASCLGGRAHRPRALSGRQGILLRTQQHLACSLCLLFLRSTRWAPSDLVLGPDASLHLGRCWEQRHVGGGGDWGPCRPSCPAGRSGCSPPHRAQDTSPKGREAFMQEVWG